ncbi:MAG: TolC family protein [Treponemataceae bacterium]|nr:TolC family protein [Treponemataceae bacterium]
MAMKKISPIVFSLFLVLQLFGQNKINANETELAAQKKSYNQKQLLDNLLVFNSELNNAREEYTRSLLDVKDAIGGFTPSIDLTVSGTYMFKTPLDRISLNTSDLFSKVQWPAGFDMTVPNQNIVLYDGMEPTLYSFQLTATQPVFTWGKLTNAYKLYKEISNVRELQVNTTENQLTTELKIRLTSLYYLNKIIENFKEQSELASKLVEMSEKAEKNGTILHLDVLEAKIQAQQLTIALHTLEDQFDSLLMGLKKLTGIDSLEWDDIMFFPPETDFYAAKEWDIAKLEETALGGSNQNLAILDHLVQVAEYTKNISNASVYWKPDFALQFSLGYSGSRLPLVETDWYRKDDYSANITLALKTTIWDGGKKINDIKRSKSSEETARWNRIEAEQTIISTLHEQMNAAELALAKIEYQELKYEAAKTKVDQQTKLNKTGYGSESALIQAEIEALTASSELMQQKMALAESFFTVQYLTESK